MIRLYYKGKGVASVGVQTQPVDTFISIDKACDYLQDELNIADEVIDEAVIQMHAHKHTVAIFNENGQLHSTGFY